MSIILLIFMSDIFFHIFLMRDVVLYYPLSVNDLISAQCAKQSLFLFNICWEKMSLLAHPS